MKYVARHYVKIAGRTFTPGEIFDGKMVPDKEDLERLLRLEAAQELKPLVLEDDADVPDQDSKKPVPDNGTKPEGDEDQKPQDEQPGEGEQPSGDEQPGEDDEAADDEENEAFREIDALEAVVQDPAPKAAEKPARKPARTAGRKKA